MERIDRLKGRYDFLSNFYPASLSIDGYRFFNSEAAYQAFKCKDPADYEQFLELNADEAKRYSRNVELREDWDEVKLSVMERVVRAKFTQNPHLARYLVETGDAEIVEGNHWNDVFWGVHTVTGEGENNLGKILMKVREEFVREGIPAVTDAFANALYREFPDGIRVYMADITQIPGDCIVNASKKENLDERGMDTAIVRAAGEELLEECARLGRCRTAEARITRGCNLPHQYIIHTAAVHYGQKNDLELLRQTHLNILELAKRNEIHSIVLPAMSARFCFPKEMATAVAIESVRAWRRENPDYEIAVSFAVSEVKDYRFLCFWSWRDYYEL